MEYKVAHIWHSKHDFSTCVPLATCLYISFSQGQAEQQDKLGAHMATCLCSFDTGHVFFVGFMLSLLCAPAPIDSLPFA